MLLAQKEKRSKGRTESYSNHNEGHGELPTVKYILRVNGKGIVERRKSLK